MKRFLAVLIAIAFCISCGKKDAQGLNQWMKNNGKLKVLSTIGMIDDLVGVIGGEAIENIMLIHGEIDPHSYELVKGDAEKFNHADVVFSNGLGLEHGASLYYQLQQHKGHVALGDHLYRQCREDLLVIDGQVDPHVWMDMTLWAKTIEPIVQTLSAARPEYAEDFKQRGEQLSQRLMDVHEELQAKMHSVPDERRFLVTSHDAFNYFARRYMATADEVAKHSWKKRVAAPEGLAPDGQLSPLDIQDIVSHLERYRIPVVFPESNVSRASLNKVLDTCAKRGVTVQIADGALYGDAMGDSYIGMMRHNVEMMTRALQ